MRICYTYWIEKIENISCGFGFPSFFFETANKSILTAAKQFREIVIYTNEIGKDILINNVEASRLCEFVVIDYSQYDFDKRYWNFPKLITYSMQEKPFMHIDFDVFLRDGFASQLIEGADIYTEMMREYEYVSNFDKFSEFGAKPKKIICSGILGGCNIDIFRTNFEIAKNVCKKNSKSKIVFEDLYAIEEYMFTILACLSNLTVQELNPLSYLHFQGKNKELRYGKMIKEFEI